MSDTADRETLKTLIPPSGLTAEKFQNLAGKAKLENLGPGEILFNAGELDRTTLYLLSGRVELISEKGGLSVVEGDSEIARHPLANQQPRIVTAKAKTQITVTRFDDDMLDVLVTWDQFSGFEVKEIGATDAGDEAECGDWMTCLLRSKVFHRIPPANIQQVFMRLEEIPFKNGDTVVKQGDEGDCYYIVNHGRCEVTRRSDTGQEIKLSTLGIGDAFGEEALLSEATRNATVTMLTDGTLMRLSKDDFDKLLRAPVQREVSFEQAQKMVKEGAVLLDVRMHDEHKDSGIPGSLSMPIYLLRLKADSLRRARKYIVYCDTGRRSSAAAYLLSERGFDAWVLAGGLNAVQQAKETSS